MNEGLGLLGLISGIIFGFIFSYLFHQNKMEKERWEYYQMSRENGELKSNIQGLEIKIEQKDYQINALMKRIDDMYESEETHK